MSAELRAAAWPRPTSVPVHLVRRRHRQTLDRVVRLPRLRVERVGHLDALANQDAQARLDLAEAHRGRPAGVWCEP